MSDTSPAEDQLEPWEEIDEKWRSVLCEHPGSRLKRIMYGTEVGTVPDEAFAADCTAADRHLEQLRADDPDDAASAFEGLSFTAVATGSAKERARAEYYLCNELMEYTHRHGLPYAKHPALDPNWFGLYPPQETGPAPQDSLTAAVIARGAEAAARWDAQTGRATS